MIITRAFGLGVLPNPRILGFLVGLMGMFTFLPNSTKHTFLCKFRSHSTIQTFKNYFATVFLEINFQFSANKRYPNTS